MRVRFCVCWGGTREFSACPAMTVNLGGGICNELTDVSILCRPNKTDDFNTFCLFLLVHSIQILGLKIELFVSLIQKKNPDLCYMS